MTRPHTTEEVLAFTVVVAFTVAAFTVVYGLEWRSASVLLPSVLLPSVLLPPVVITGQVTTRHVITRRRLADTIPTHLATRPLAIDAEHSSRRGLMPS